MKEIQIMTNSARTFDAQTINIYKMPEQGDQVLFADKSLWTIKQREQMKWGLYAENNIRHSAIGLHASMIEFCAAINAQAEFIRLIALGQTI